MKFSRVTVLLLVMHTSNWMAIRAIDFPFEINHYTIMAGAITRWKMDRRCVVSRYTNNGWVDSSHTPHKLVTL